MNSLPFYDSLKNMEKSIRVECEGKGTKDLNELLDFQGNLKSLSDENYLRLKREILTEGFCFAVNIWTDPETHQSFIIGGHQRIRTLKKLRDEEGYTIPPIPFSLVYAKDWKQAKRRVLADVAQYGHVESQGLYEFTTHADIGIDDLTSSFDIPGIEMDSYKTEFYDDAESKTVSFEAKPKTGAKELGEEEFSEFEHQCPKCGFEFDA